MSVVKINAIEVPEGGGPELERRFGARLGAVEGTPGFLGFELLRPVAGETRYFVYTRWETEEAFRAWSDGSGRAAHAGERARPVATGSAVLEFEVVQSTGPRPDTGRHSAGHAAPHPTDDDGAPHPAGHAAPQPAGPDAGTV